MWVNEVPPLITYSLAAGQSITLSFSNQVSGAWSAIYSDTVMFDGMISNTIGEFTFAGIYSTVDVSRLVNMNGHSMSIVGPKCTSDMNTCVFECPTGKNSCMTGYILTNCATDSQPGANYGEFDGAPSGGCSDMGTSAQLRTSLS